MDFELNDLQQMLRESARAFVSSSRGHGHTRSTEEDWAVLARLGWLALQLPEEMGGADGGPNEVTVLMEALGEALTTAPFLSTAVIGARAIVRHAGATRRQALLPRLADGTLRVAFAHSKSGCGSRHLSPGTRVARTGSGYRLSGEMVYVLDGPSADMLVVSASREGGEDGGIELFLIDGHAPGVERRDFSRLDGGGASHLRLRDVEVGPEDRLGGSGGGALVLMDLVDLATVAIAAEAVGIMQALHDRTLEYLKTRRQFGRSLGEFQVLQHRQVDVLIAVEQARSIVMAAAMALADEDPAARRLVPMAKVVAGRAGRFVAQSAVQSHGAIGMTAELPIGAYFKRMMVIDRAFGAADEHLRVLAGVCPAPTVSFPV